MEQITWNQFFMAPVHLMASWHICTKPSVDRAIEQTSCMLASVDTGPDSGDALSIDQNRHVVDNDCARSIHDATTTLFLFPMTAIAIFTDYLFNPYGHAETENVRMNEQDLFSKGIEETLADEGNQQTRQSETVASSSATERPEKCININTADESTLMTIPGIGLAKATAIISYREAHGLFSSPESLIDVAGIGQKTFEKHEQFITVE